LSSRTLGPSDLLKLLDHFLMILNHLLSELFYFGTLCLLLGKLAELDFGLVIGQKACRQILFDFLVLATSSAEIRAT